MKIIDTHCDALLKLQLARKGSKYKTPLNFTSSIELETNYQRLQSGQIKVQFFAIFLYPTVPVEEKWADALTPGGRLYFEVGIGQADSVLRIMRSRGFGDIQIVKDLNDIPRVVFGTLMEEV